MQKAPLAIVGIGASAGGLEAFRLFFENMPADTGLAFVVILHLPANRKSMLAEILARWTTMPVVEASDGQLIEPDHVYVPSPHSVATIMNGHLRIHMPMEDAPREDRQIDGFFDSLAALREAAVGIVLSGSGSDGALGLKAIKESGGLTMAQGVDGAAPQYDSMPTGAVATGAVDLVVPVQTMPGHLVRIYQAPPAPSPEPATADAVEAARLEICTLLRVQLGHDFSGYKDKTFLRRVQRRMQVLNITSLADYVARLRLNPAEGSLLFRDLLIRVTSFFRDAEAFEVLERVAVPRLFEGKSANATVRVWVPGCATGEEAYSLAILMQEHMDRLPRPPSVKIFATDIDEPAIATARAGHYPATLLDGLSDARRQRFFTATPTGYVIAKGIRELCTFSEHSLVRDPPFSRMDLISCRNLLIYLDANLQTVVIPAFHYSLVPGGLLLLGSSETTARHEDLFAPLDKAAHIFQKRNAPTAAIKLFQQNYASPSQRATTPARPVAPGRADQTPVARRPPDHQASKTLAAPRDGTWRGLIAGLGSRLPVLRGIIGAGRAELQALRRELTETQLQLQAITEEHDTALEELRSSNEELQSVNEEFQSTNEELETSREEIQSVNEELHTVNAQLSEKVDELDRFNSDLRNLFDSTDVATIFLDRHMVIRGYTPAVGTIYNLIPSDEGRPITDIVSHLRYTGLRDDVGEVLRTLTPLERQVTHEDGQTHYIMRVLPYRGPDSEVNGTLVTFLNVTSIVQAEQHQRLLVDELNHRVKNMLTVVISLAAQTLRRSTSLEEFSTAFMGRVHGLTASYALLSRESWAKVSMREVLVEELRPYQSTDRANLVMEGPPVMLSPQGALAIGMAFHELATNAVKYGALSVAEGTVKVIWDVTGETDRQKLVLHWIEANGPPVQQPTRHGFGMTLIERGFAHELSGTAEVNFNASGLEATLTAPLGASVFLATAAELKT